MSQSEWITWESCPRCGNRSAVGWSAAGRSMEPVEFDCAGGCRLTVCELVREFTSEGFLRQEQLSVDDLGHASKIACDAARRGAAVITIAAGLRGVVLVTIIWRTEER